MADLQYVFKVAGLTALASFVFVIFFFQLVVSVPLSAFLAAAGLIPVGGFVVGGLIALSFEDEHPQEEH